MREVLHYTNVTATVIGYVVMAAWIIGIVLLISMVVNEFRFSRLLKKRKEHEFDRVRSEWLSDMRDLDSSDRFDTTEIPIDFKFYHQEDFVATEETAAVFDIRERYPNEFA